MADPTELADILDGTSGNDTIDALGGDDTVTSGGGLDNLGGGAGNDTIVLDGQIAGGSLFNGGSESDTLKILPGAMTSYDYGTFATLLGSGVTNFETLQFGSQAGETVRVLTSVAQLAGVTTLTGGAGADVLVVVPAGPAGTYSLQPLTLVNWTDGTDFVVFTAGGGAGNFTLNVGLHTGTFSVSGAGGDDTLNGSDGVESLAGADGNDILNGQGGNDRLIGGIGKNTLNGGADDDTLVVDATFLGGSAFNGGSGIDTLELHNVAGQPLTTSSQFPAGIATTSHAMIALPVTSIERIDFQSTAGNQLSMLLGFGGSFPFTSQISGTGVSETAELIGGAGYDGMVLIANHTAANTPSGMALTAPSFVYKNWSTPARAYFPGDRVFIINNGDANGTITGTAHAGIQSLSGGTGAVTMTGSADMDFLTGGGTGSQLLGNGGNDTLGLTNQISISTAGDGSQVTAAETTATGQGVTYDGGSGFDFLQLGGNVNFQGTVKNIEGLYLSPAFANKIQPGLANTTSQNYTTVTTTGATWSQMPGNLEIDGKGSVIVGLAPGDSFDGSGYTFDAGSEVVFTVNGSTADDTIKGTSGNDTLAGSGGNDTIYNGGGKDLVDAGEGDDTVVINAQPVATIPGSPGVPAIPGSSFKGGNGTDTLELRNLPSATTSYSYFAPSGLLATSYSMTAVTLSSFEKVAFKSSAGTSLTATLLIGGEVGSLANPFAIANQAAGIGELSGSDGVDGLALVYLTLAGKSYTVDAPTFTYTNWSTAARAYQASDRTFVLVNGDGDVTLNASLHTGVQHLSTVGGNDTINGTDGMEFINAGGGVNQMFGKGGDDTLSIGNSAFRGLDGVLGAATTSTGAGSTFDGGDGTDFLSAGGTVDFKGKLVSIEGIHLQSAITNAAPGTVSQTAAVLTIDGATMAGLPSTLILDGQGQIVVNMASGDTFDGAGYAFDVGSDVKFTVNGSTAADTITGTSRNDVLNGGNGDDRLNGGGGANALHGGDDNDTLVIDRVFGGGSKFDGGAGTDTLELHPFAGQGKSASVFNPVAVPNTSINATNATFASVERIDFQSNAGETLSFQLGFGGSLTNQIGAAAIAPAAELVGGAGTDTLLLSAVYTTANTPGGFTIDAPSFNYTNWTTPDRAYQSGDRVVILNNGNASGVMNGTAHAGVQHLSGGTGIVTINGSDDMDYLTGGGDGSKLYGKGGNDSLALANGVVTIVFANGATNQLPEGTNTGANTLFDGGDGSDFMTFGGKVDFKGTMHNIEGIYLTPGYSNTVQPGQTFIISQNPTAVTMNGAQWAALPADLMLGGEGSIAINLAAGNTFNGTGYVFDAGANVTFTINGSASADLFFASAGNDTIDGGAGIDHAGFLGKHTDHAASAGADGTVVIDGDSYTNVEVFKFTDGAFRWDGATLVSTDVGGTVADGYIAGATVYIDVNGNGQLDPDEPSTTTDANGDFLMSSHLTGPIRAFGGKNVDTGLANALTFSAPEGATQVNPLTTLIQELVESGDSAATAEAKVEQALGLDPTLDLANLDLIAAAATDPEALAAQKAAAAVAEVLDAVADGGGDAGAALAELVEEIGDGGAVDLTDPTVLTAVLGAGLPGSSTEQIEQLVEETQAVTEAISQATDVGDITEVQANHAPVAAADTANVNEDATVTGNILTNDNSVLDADDHIAVTSVSGQAVSGSTAIAGAFGTLTIAANGNYSYAASADGLDALAAGVHRTDQFTYEIDDGNGGIASSSLTIDIATISDLVTLPGANGKTAINGTGADERITGGTGRDTIHGLGGSDRIEGDNGNDALYGDDGWDLLLGGNGNDTLYGGNGEDVLAGGKGADILFGGFGADVFDFGNAGGDADVISDFEMGIDHIHLSGEITVSGMSVSGGTTTLSLSNGGSIALTGVIDVVDYHALLTPDLPVWTAGLVIV